MLFCVAYSNLSLCVARCVVKGCVTQDVLNSICALSKSVNQNVVNSIEDFSHKITPSSLIAKKFTNKPLKLCQKQHVSNTSQSIEHRSSLPDGLRVLFSTTTPILQQQPHLCKAHQAQNTIIDSHSVAIEVHKQHCIQYTAVNSGSSSHSYPLDYTGEQRDSTVDPIYVDCANKVVMVSLTKDIIHFNKLSLAVKKCHKFKKIWLSLLSMPILCKSKLTVTLKGKTVEASDNNGNIHITTVFWIQ